ncbi:nuclear transport factor 2 family protein [Sphingobium sp. Sx8-8]|uniref:nuclear transport factor 2 family protein n=1 Tax=Sphingobium sp. Sx8-8 TaxID=2933617 RepID=UPI001F59F184|nr:nuclear transport factor 2 family protein [Sphingobium sp. Sx8-8]
MSFSGPGEDRLAIRELIDAYADAVTRNDAGAWSLTWTQDGEWSIPDGAGQTLTARGREAILALWTEAMKQFPGVVFQAWPGAITVDGQHAAVRSYTCETYGGEAGTTTVRGRYEDLCVKQDGHWRFRRRIFTPLSDTFIGRL